MQVPIQSRTALWDQVWEEYDQRRQTTPAPACRPASWPVPLPAAPLAPAPLAPAPLAPRVARRRRGAGWQRGVRCLAALCIIVGATTYATAPILAAARVGKALATGDVAGLQAAVDWQSLSPALRQGMEATVRDSDGGASGFLAGMADEMARGLATPEGLMALMRERLAAGPGSGGMGMIGAIRPASGGRLQVALHAPGENREAMTVTLALRDALSLRWQVVGLEVPRPLPGWEG